MKREGASERDMLADAALAVETAPWPKPQTISLVSRITGAEGDDRVTRSDAVEIYVGALRPAGARFEQLSLDARANINAAARLEDAARNALTAPRLTMNDVVMVETAIQALRENRQIYFAAARQIEKSGEAVDGAALDGIREGYAVAIHDLGEAADAIADRIERDRTENFAAPAPASVNKFSNFGL
ncbi:MAG: hypothetical protein R3C58_04460 [Parvularculaceae bacterium]